MKHQKLLLAVSCLARCLDLLHKDVAKASELAELVKKARKIAKLVKPRWHVYSLFESVIAQA